MTKAMSVAMRIAIARIIALYEEQDIYYVGFLAQEGRRPEGMDTVEDMIEHIRYNNLAEGCKESEIVKVAKKAFKIVKKTEEEIFRQYNA